MSYFKCIPSLWNTSWVGLPFLFASPFVLAYIGGWRAFHEKQPHHLIPVDFHFSQDLISLIIFKVNFGIERHSIFFDLPIMSILILFFAFVSFLIVILYPLFNLYEIRVVKFESVNKKSLKEMCSQEVNCSKIKNIFSRKINTNTKYGRYKELVLMVSGNESTAERLINLEASKQIGKSREEVIEIAIAKLLRDRR